jgi:putative ABC transport system permease protein
VNRFILSMARREGRASRRRLALYMGSITIGVAALVAINSFRRNVSAAISSEARALLGADLELSSSQPFDSTIRGILDSLETSGIPISYVTSFASMVLAEGSGILRLTEVRAVTAGYPYYGDIETDPPNYWNQLVLSRQALVDPALLIQLDAAVGDTLRIGEARFPVTGQVIRTPGEVALRTAIGPRVFIPAAYLEETQLLKFGSRARYLAYFKMEESEVQRLLNRYHELFRQHRVSYETVREREDELTDGLETLARFLGLVGLVALLLGGMGVASAVSVFTREKLPTAAVLRCLGATQREVVAIYLLQARGLAFPGSAIGVGLGILVQSRIPDLLADFLPLEVAASVDWESAAAGLAIGVWVALVFALLPLLDIRNVPPLAALRREYEATGRETDPVRYAAYVALVGSVTLLSVWQAPWSAAGFSFAGGIVVTTAILAGMARGLMLATRRLFPRRASYVLRQGIANLFRPHNQTTAVSLAVGFGVFLLATLYVVQRNLLDQLRLDMRQDRPNLVIFDIQQHQLEAVTETIRRRGFRVSQEVPIVPARIAAINGRSVSGLLSDSGPLRPSRWALRREYRNTYRDTLVESERLVKGSWWEFPARDAGSLPRISVEADVAQELGVSVGDRITWDVQGVLVETEVANLRQVNWARFEPNFFVVFEPRALERAPQSFVILTRADHPRERAELQRDLVIRHSNVAVLDLTLVQQTLDTVLGSVALAIRFMAWFSIIAGLVVLAGAIATSRFQRMKESVLLKTLGADRGKIGRIVITEYGVLGTVAALSGIGLSSLAGWLLARFLFEIPFSLPILELIGLGLFAALATTLVGLANSYHVFRAPPLAVIRELGD